MFLPGVYEVRQYVERVFRMALRSQAPHASAAGAWVPWSVVAPAVACLDLTRLSSFIQPGYNQSETSYVTEEIGTSGYAASLDRYGWWLNKLTGLRQCYQRQTFG